MEQKKNFGKLVRTIDKNWSSWGGASMKVLEHFEIGGTWYVRVQHPNMGVGAFDQNAVENVKQKVKKK